MPSANRANHHRSRQSRQYSASAEYQSDLRVFRLVEMLRGLVSVTDLLDRRNFNSAREVNSRNNPHIPYPGAEDVFMRLRSVSAHEDEDFADLRLVDSLDAFRESARSVQGRVMRDDVSPWDRGMLNRGLVPDPLEHSSPTRDLCLGYAASIGVMACNHIGGLGDQVADDLQRIFVAC